MSRDSVSPGTGPHPGNRIGVTAHLRDAVEAVMQLHATIDDNGRRVCQTCGTPAPCSTVRTVRQEMAS